MDYPLDMRRILVSFLLALGLIVSVAPPALAVDIKGPVLLDWKLLDGKADISNGNAIVRVEFSISDDSEINSPLLQVSSSTSTQNTGLIFPKRMSKVGKTSTYQAAATILFGRAPGEWSWSLSGLSDVLGNFGDSWNGGTWPNIIMVYDKDFTEAKQLAELKAKQEAEEKAATELKAKQEAEEKAAAELKAKQEAEAKAAAELKAKQEAEANAAAELKAKQEAEAKAAADKAAGEKIISDAKAEATRILAAAKAAAAKKKTTITCVKGKLTKKVTAVKPVCPKGYKKKA